MKKFTFTLALAVCFTAGYSQLFNNGGTITVENGATLVVEGSYTATNSGSMVIDGTVQLKGDFINTSGTVPDGSNGRLVFNGTAGQQISGASTTFYCAVEVNNATGVTLASNNEVMDSILVMTSGNMTLGANHLTMANEVITTGSSSSYIVTNGAGELKQTVGATNVTFPVGTASVYNPLILNNSGTSDTYGVIATTTMPTNWTTSNHAVGLTWLVSEAVAGASSLTATPQWTSGQQQASFDNTDCAVGVTTNDGTSFTWAPSGTATGGGPFTRSGSGFTDVGKFVVADYFFEGFDLNMNLFLAGPYNGSTMNTGLTVPTTDPYGLSTTINPIPAGTVDWIKVQLRNSTTPTTVEKSMACLVDQNGAISAKVTGVPKGTYYVSVHHRNHLGACTGSAVTMTGAEPYAFDFTNTGSSLWGTNAMRTIGGVRALWAGDANGDGQVIYQGSNNDPTGISGAILAAPGNTGSLWTYTLADGYNANDINLDGQVIYQGTNNDPTSISNSVLGHPGNTGSLWTYVLTAQLP